MHVKETQLTAFFGLLFIKTGSTTTERTCISSKPGLRRCFSFLAKEETVVDSHLSQITVLTVGLVVSYR